MGTGPTQTVGSFVSEVADRKRDRSEGDTE
jgi:hypothetical protein